MIHSYDGTYPKGTEALFSLYLLNVFQKLGPVFISRIMLDLLEAKVIKKLQMILS